MTAADTGAPRVLTEIRDGVLLIRMNRPEKKNALTSAMYTTMVGALQDAEANDVVRAVFLAGCEQHFTSGNDVMDFISAPPANEEAPVVQFLYAIANMTKPLVAAVCGTAIGLGTTMLPHCDLVYAGDNARFQMPFVNLGLCPEAASSFLLPRIMGYARAAELILLGRPFDAAKALEVGLVNAVFPAAEVEEAVWAKARELAAQPPAAVRLAKALLKRGASAVVNETIREENARFSERLRSPEAAEAFQAFMQRRKPDFSQFK